MKQNGTRIKLRSGLYSSYIPEIIDFVPLEAAECTLHVGLAYGGLESIDVL